MQENKQFGTWGDTKDEVLSKAYEVINWQLSWNSGEDLNLGFVHLETTQVPEAGSTPGRCQDLLLNN